MVNSQMREKKQVRVYKDDKEWLHNEKRVGESYAEAFSRLLDQLETEQAQPAK